MIEMRWVYHDLKYGSPPAGSICIEDGLYQKLQYRLRKVIEFQTNPTPVNIQDWGEWKDVPIDMSVGATAQ